MHCSPSPRPCFSKRSRLIRFRILCMAHDCWIQLLEIDQLRWGCWVYFAFSRRRRPMVTRTQRWTSLNSARRFAVASSPLSRPDLNRSAATAHRPCHKIVFVQAVRVTNRSTPICHSRCASNSFSTSQSFTFLHLRPATRCPAIH